MRELALVGLGAAFVAAGALVGVVLISAAID